MSHFLVTYKTDYADDFDVYGLALFTADAFTAYLATLDTLLYPVHYGFGTNEQIEYDAKRDILKDFTIQELSDAEYSLLLKLFPRGIFGNFPEADDWHDNSDYWDDDYDDGGGRPGFSSEWSPEIDNQFPG